MDIEAIRKRNEDYLNRKARGLVDSEIGNSVTFLLDHTSFLESRLRWKKVEEEKPGIGKKIEAKTERGLVEIVSLENDLSGERPYWLGHKLYPFSYFVEWREI